MPGSIEALVAVAAAEIDALQREVTDLRRRCHELESDRATIRVLQQAVTELREQLPSLARQAAREAVRESKRQDQADRWSQWRSYAAVGSFGVALGALIVALLHG